MEQKTLGTLPLIISTFLIAIYAGFYSKKACWYNSKMIFAASNQGIMFSQKLNNSYFHETFVMFAVMPIAAKQII